VAEGLRLAELLGSFSFAGDLGRGQPMGHVLRTTRISVALAERLGLSGQELADVYYTGLLVHAGCTAGSAQFAAFLASDELSAQRDFCLCDPNNMGQMFGWLRRNVARDRPLPARVVRMLQLMSRGEKAFQDIDQGCSEVGSRIAARLGMSEATQLGLYHICEGWNGRGPHRLRGGDIPLAARIVNVAMILEVFVSERGPSSARQAAESRARKSFDPEVAAAAASLADDTAFWAEFGEQEPWGLILDLEPPPVRYVDESMIDDVCYALADIVDLKSPATAVHSRRTAQVAEAIAVRLGLQLAEITLVRRAALVHDVGLVAVPTHLLERGTTWSEVDFERFRLHTYYTERILARSPALRDIGEVACAHHENVDGTGYHRSLAADRLSLPARIVAAATAYVEGLEAIRSGATDPDSVLAALRTDETLDVDAVSALAATMQLPPAVPVPGRPAGLTDRELEVLRLVAAGLSLKEAARRLVISDHTARHHVESIYGKAGVSSRSGLTLYAVEHGLLDYSASRTGGVS